MTEVPVPIQRIFLDWNTPALHAVARDLVGRSSSGPFVDLTHLILVFPGGQAGRRCLELLIDEAGGKLSPPQIVTVGQLPELLYVPQRPFASLFVQQLVWAEALRSIPSQRLQAFIRQPPDRDDRDGWLRLGDLLRQQHVELGRDQLDFADVWRQGSSLDGFDEVDRWKLLAEIQQEYWRLLDGYQLWDQQTARLEAIKRHECRTDREIITIGTVDLNRTMRAMLDQVADQVTCYVHAPESAAANFDRYGCLIPDRWAEGHVELHSEQILMAEDAADQCSAVVSVMTGFQGKYGLEDVTVGVPDPRLVLPLQRTFQEYGVKSHWPVDCELAETAPYRLLSAVASFLEGRSAADFSVLIRHPDLGSWLQSQNFPGDWITAWDRYFQQHLPRRIGSDIEANGSSSVQNLKRTIQRLLKHLPTDKLPLSGWAEPVADFLQAIYGQRNYKMDDIVDRRLLSACQKIIDTFAAHADLPRELDFSASATDAIRLTLELAAGELYQANHEPAVQIMGWLEMPLDDAPAAIVTTFNESFVPTSLNHDLFLPNRLRAHLGIEDNARRYARDLYVLQVLVHARSDLKLIVARRDTSNDPLTPSRLLFATEPEKIAQRILEFYEPRESHSWNLPPSPRSIAATSGFEIPRPQPRTSAADYFRVTEFRDYLSSPYRYYLKHVLRLAALDDRVSELDGGAFGTLIHEVLNRFGQSDIRDSISADQIAAYLDQELEQVLLEDFGENPLAAVLIQQEQARRRLSAFAQWQSRWTGNGWKIQFVEWTPAEPVPLQLGDGRTIHLSGRIDRIDYHPATGSWAIFDYKTGDAGTAPEKTHRSHEEWCDLQLPLYRHLAAEAGVEGDVQLGYIVLPRDTNSVEALFAEWSDEELESADDVARRVASQVLDEKFWVVLSDPPQTMAEYDDICQVGVFGQEVIV